MSFNNDLYLDIVMNVKGPYYIKEVKNLEWLFGCIPYVSRRYAVYYENNEVCSHFSKDLIEEVRKYMNIAYTAGCIDTMDKVTLKLKEQNWKQE